MVQIADSRVTIDIDGAACSFAVRYRPHVKQFLTAVAEWYTVRRSLGPAVLQRPCRG